LIAGVVIALAVVVAIVVLVTNNGGGGAGGGRGVGRVRSAGGHRDNANNEAVFLQVIENLLWST
jgi:preprotein translocase subunit SecG